MEKFFNIDAVIELNPIKKYNYISTKMLTLEEVRRKLKDAKKYFSATADQSKNQTQQQRNQNIVILAEILIGNLELRGQLVSVNLEGVISQAQSKISGNSVLSRSTITNYIHALHNYTNLKFNYQGRQTIYIQIIGINH